MSTPTLQPSARPIAPTPLFDNIPQELRDRQNWIVWRYEEKKGKWTKVLYTPFTVTKASTTASGTWRSFRAARACYEDRPDFFDGIGYVFSANDPYVGGDIDHCRNEVGELSGLALTHLPATYAEISPSGSGVKFIARAAPLASGRKTAKGELYSSGRYFTITGRVIDQAHTTITDQQDAVDAFLTVLGGARTAGGGGGAANGDRAALAASIPRSAWDEANELQRTHGDRLLRRARAAGGEETQLAFVLRGDYAGFHARWSFVGLYRADGTLDESQVIAVTAYGLRPRGFTFPEFATILNILYGKETAARKGLARWRQDIAALWFKAPAPRFTPRQEAQSPDGIYSVRPATIGRAGDTRDRVYNLLLDYRIGVDALVTIGELAASLNVDRRTVNKALNQLRSAGRIQTRRAGRYAGLVVTFSDGIISAAPAAAHATVAPEIETAPPALEETDARTHTPRVSSEHGADPGSDLELQSLVDLVGDYLDNYAEPPRQLLKRKTGEVRCVAYVHTVERFLILLAALLPGRWSDGQVRGTYRAVLRARRADYWRSERAKLRPARLDADGKQVGLTDAGLYAAICARQRGLARNIGRQLEGQWRKRLEMADEERRRRGLPEAPPTARKRRAVGELQAGLWGGV